MKKVLIFLLIAGLLLLGTCALTADTDVDEQISIEEFDPTGIGDPIPCGGGGGAGEGGAPG
ncbi:MAG: hypothetical protein HXS46_07455 [Theionarchaea archaeon]|nr:MAG: hypothetical protein AYK18_01795 [Theionarchaea archaeon DG-70]MBU7010511.1 hypothetical protein [Theionarchaea archaeon]